MGLGVWISWTSAGSAGLLMALLMKAALFTTGQWFQPEAEGFVKDPHESCLYSLF